MNIFKISSLSVIAAVSVIAVGCGDDEGGEALSKDEFVKQGNAICKKYDAEGDKLGQPTSVQEIPEYADKALALFEKQVDEMNDLQPPEDLQEDFDKFLATADDAKKFIGDLKTAAESGDEKKVSEVAEQGDARDQESDEIATKLGLTECAQD